MEGQWGIFLLIILIVLGLLAAWWNHQSQKKRVSQLAVVAEGLSLLFFPDGDPSIQPAFADFSLMQRGRDKRLRNLIRGETEHVCVDLFDYRYVTGSGKHRTTHEATAATFVASSLSLPQFELGPEGLLHKIASTFGYQDIDFDGYPEFNRRYLLRGANEKAIRKFFTVDVVEYFAAQSHRHRVEASRDRLMIYADSLIKPTRIPEFLEQAFATYGALKQDQFDDRESSAPDDAHD